MMPNGHNTGANEDQARFESHLEKASATVRTWPAWKQAILGGFNGCGAGQEQANQGHVADTNQETQHTE